MRKLLLILLLFSSAVYGQQNNTTNTNFTNGLGASKFFNIPRGTTLPTTGILAGSLFYHTTLGLQYYDGSSWQTVGVSGSGVTAFNSRTGAITPISGDYSAFYPLLAGSYADPSWITSLAWSKITGAPTAFPTPFSLTAGYGLTGDFFNGNIARTWVVDTTSTTGLVSKSRLDATNFGISRVTGLQDSLSNKLNKTGGAMSGQLTLKEATTSSDYSKGLIFPPDPYGGFSDIAGLRLYNTSGENQTLELYTGNDLLDLINFRTGAPDTSYNNNVKINGNTILNAANFNDYSPSLTGTGSSGVWPISVTGNASTVTTNANLTGDITSSGNATTYNVIVPSTKGGSGINNSGTLTWGLGGTLGSNAYTSTSYLPLTGGDMSGQIRMSPSIDIAYGDVAGSNFIGQYYNTADNTLRFYNGTGGDDIISINRNTSVVSYPRSGGVNISGAVVMAQFPSITAGTSGRVPYFTTAGQLTDAADLTFNGSNLSVVAPTSGSHVVNKTYADATYAPIASPALTGTPTAPTATAGTNTTQIATTAFVQAAIPTVVNVVEQDNFNAVSSDAVYSAIRPYKVYTAVISQSGTAAPTVDYTLENSIGAIVWSRTAAGVYKATLTGAFTASKVWISVTNGVFSGATSAAKAVSVYRNSANEIEVDTYDSSASADDVLSLANIEIRVYN